MRFSIICTNYNKELYIKECIESVLNQTFTDFEFLIIDDASKDHSLEIIEDYSTRDNRIKVLKNEKNIGMAGGYNKAIPLAQGELLCLIDSDDFWFPNKLQLVHEYFNIHNDCVMHQHPLQIFEFTKPTQNYYRPFLYGGNMVQYIKETKQIPLYVATTGLTFKTNVVQKVLPIPLSFAKNGEAFFTRTVICYGEVGLTYLALGGYRKTDTNIVFGNASWDSHHYVENILKPELNKFYAANHIDLYFEPVDNNIKNSHSLRQKIKYLLKRKAKNILGK